MPPNNALSLEKVSPVSALGLASPLSKTFQRRALFLALVVSDGLMLGLAFLIAYVLRFTLGLALVPDIVPVSLFYPYLVAFLIPLWICLFAVFGLYKPSNILTGTLEYGRVFNACTAGMMLVVVATFLDPTFVVARGWLVASWLLSFFFVSSARFWLRRFIYLLRKAGLFLSRVAIVGTNQEARALAEQLTHSSRSGFCVVGSIAGQKRPDTNVEGCGPLLGTIDEIEELVEVHELDDLIVATTALNRQQLLDLFERTNQFGNVELFLSSGLFEVLTTGVRVTNAGFVPLMSPKKLRLDGAELVMKTAFEYSLTACALIVLAPLFAAIALLIKLDSPGPVLHRRRVLGVGGKEFDALKFRTMSVNGDRILDRHPELARQLKAERKLKNDPRVTEVGRWLRKYSLDELPQLINVLKGQMGLVGPRMISPEEAKEYGKRRFNLLTVKPGITGLWQVSGRSDLDYNERVRLDMYYIRNYTIWRDLQILFIETLPAVLKGRGAY
jgi:exopolysaccharide biosynthesis polyprenyl glycosylphosphotransferase